MRLTGKLSRCNVSAAGFVLALTSLAASAMAQTVVKGDKVDAARPLSALFTDLKVLSLMVGITLLAYLTATVITHLFVKTNPITAARVACWIGVLLWVLLFIFYILGTLLHIYAPIWAWLVVSLVLIFALVGLLGTRPRTAH